VPVAAAIAAGGGLQLARGKLAVRRVVRAGSRLFTTHHQESDMRIPLLLVALTLATSCTWVHMAPGASAVRVVEGPPAGCENRGEIEVSVRHNLAFYDRNQRKVRDELETLARNEAPGINADTVQPLGPPSNGSQRYAAWRCGGR
jgi:hypothetical protein